MESSWVRCAEEDEEAMEEKCADWAGSQESEKEHHKISMPTAKKQRQQGPEDTWKGETQGKILGHGHGRMAETNAIY